MYSFTKIGIDMKSTSLKQAWVWSGLLLFKSLFLVSCTIGPLLAKTLVWIGSTLLASALGMLLEETLNHIPFISGNKKTTLDQYVEPIPGRPLEGRWTADCLFLEITGQRKADEIRTTKFCIPGKFIKLIRSTANSKDWQLNDESKALVRERNQVAGVQVSLIDLGYDPGRLDGIWGPKTRSALLQFQKSRYDLNDSGELDYETESALVNQSSY